MNFIQVKRIAKGYKTLSQLLDWQQLYQYINQGVGLEIARIDESMPQQTVLVLAPHPDDEVFGCGGAIRLHCKKGDSVHIVYLTDGSRGNKAGKRDKALVAIREHEAIAGLHILGEAATQFWRFPDGAFEINKTTTGLMRGVLEKIQPDVLYIPWYGDDHPDHRAVLPLILEVLPILKKPFRGRVCQYEVWTPLVTNYLVPIGDVVEEKIRAMEAHQSQLGDRSYRDGILGLNAYRGALGGLQEPAEAYFVLTHERFLHFSKTLTLLP